MNGGMTEAQGVETAVGAGMRLADLVYMFCAAKIGDTFRASELGTYIATHRADVSPESLNRTLRALRNNGSVRYFADGKRRSTYHVVGVC